MMSLFFPLTGLLSHAFSFLLGVLFLPVGLFAAAYYVFQSLPPATSSLPLEPVSEESHDRLHRVAEQAAERAQSGGITPPKVGWLRITREEKGSQDINNFTDLVKLGITHIMESKQQQANRRSKDLHYVTLKFDTLFLYASEEQIECRGVIILPMHTVAIHPPGLPDNEVFHKERPILLTKKPTELDPASSLSDSQVKNNYYIYADSPTLKEDWYFALWHAARLRDPPSAATRLTDQPQPITSPQGTNQSVSIDPRAIADLQRTLHSSENHLQTQWLNAVMGRIFLAVYRTEMVKQHFINKFRLKITKLKKPSFLGDIEVRDLHVGDSVPYITNPKLLALQDNGELTAEMYVHYSGGFRCEIQTEVQLSVTTRLKSLRVPLTLAVVLKSLTGKLQFKIKPAPCNRFWIGFYETPSMDLVIEPIVSEKQVKFGMVIQAIEKRIYDIVNETLVLPNMDDTPFFPSHGTGGIFEQFLVKPEAPVGPPAPADPVPEPTGSGTHSSTGSGSGPDLLAGTSTVPQPPVGEDLKAAQPTPSTTRPSPPLPGAPLEPAATEKSEMLNRNRSNSQPIEPSMIRNSSTGAPGLLHPNTNNSSRALTLLQSMKGRPVRPKASGLVPPSLPQRPSPNTQDGRRASVGSASVISQASTDPASRSTHRSSVASDTGSSALHSHSDSDTGSSCTVDSDFENEPGTQHSQSPQPPAPARVHVGPIDLGNTRIDLPPHSPTIRAVSASFPPHPTSPQQPMGRGHPIPYNLPMGQGLPHSEAHLYGAPRIGESGHGATRTGTGSRFSWLNNMLPEGKRPHIPGSGTAASSTTVLGGGQPIPVNAPRSPYGRGSDFSSTGQLPWNASNHNNSSQSTFGTSPGSSSILGTSPSGSGLSGKLGWLNSGIESLKQSYQQQKAQLLAHSNPSHTAGLLYGGGDGPRDHQPMINGSKPGSPPELTPPAYSTGGAASSSSGSLSLRELPPPPLPPPPPYSNPVLQPLTETDMRTLSSHSTSSPPSPPPKD